MLILMAFMIFSLLLMLLLWHVNLLIPCLLRLELVLRMILLSLLIFVLTMGTGLRLNASVLFLSRQVRRTRQLNLYLFRVLTVFRSFATLTSVVLDYAGLGGRSFFVLPCF
ncbi:MAG: hypothetical protein [Microviridae sp.]|nr:MAG: hypothetical protein [Microviridae sp.]